MILYLLCHRCTIFFNYHFCMRAHMGWDTETEGGGLARWAESFYLTPWDDVKSPVSLPPPTPSSLPYAEELAEPLALCGGLGSWLSAHTHTHTVPPTRNGEQQIFLLWGETFSTRWPVQENPLFLQWTTFWRKEILCFYTNKDIQKKSSRWNNKCQSCENIEMYTSSLLTETVGCIKLLWTPVMRKLWLVLPLGVEKHPCHCACGTVFSFLVPSAGHLPYCITHKQYLYQFWFF